MAGIKEIGQQTVQLELPESKKSQGAGDFKDYLKAYVDEVDRLQKQAGETTEKLVAGETENIHEAMVAMEKAEVSFKLMVETRNRIVKAYEEIMKMSV